jgi:hypothetical protein
MTGSDNENVNGRKVITSSVTTFILTAVKCPSKVTGESEVVYTQSY